MKIFGESRKEHQKKKKQEVLSRLRVARLFVQAGAFFLAPSLFSQAFGAVKEAASQIGNGGVLSMTVFVVRLLILCGITVFFGRIFCGWFCAFGAVNDWIYQCAVFLQKKTGMKLPKIPSAWIPFLQKLKYAVLCLVLVLCFFGKNDRISKYSPWTVFSMVTGRNFRLAGYGVAVFLCILMVTGMACAERFFCQFFCPMGAVFSLLPELPFTALHRKGQDCIQGCEACKRNCPVHVKLGENSLQSGECIRCGRCMITCPKKNISVVFLRHRLDR